THDPSSVAEVNPVIQFGLPEVPKTDSPPVIKVDPPPSERLEKWPPMPFHISSSCMQITATTTFFLAIMAVLVSYVSVDTALILATTSIFSAAMQLPENSMIDFAPVCAMEGQAYTKIIIGDLTIIALVDTGSALTLILESLLPRLGNPMLYPSPVPNAQSMSGIFPLLGIIYIDIILPASIVRK
ncbi:MAG: hypothetical protein GY861_06145, partial [bacterium]|nr:hypothetical protein [bacterium]